MHFPVYIKYRLRCRDSYIVNKGIAEVAKAGSPTRSGSGGEDGAAGSAVQVEAQIGTEPAHGGGGGRKNRVDIGVLFEDRPESQFNYHGQVKVGAGTFEQGQ